LVEASLESGSERAEEGVLSTRGAARRTAFIAAAREVFLEQGYERASVNEIVRRAGGSLTTLYAQFGDKSGLFRAVIEARSSEVLRPLDDIANAHLPIREGLAAFGRLYVSVLTAESGIAIFRVMISESARIPEINRRFLEVGPRRVVELLAQYLEERAALGELSCPNPTSDADHLSAMFRGSIHLRALLIGSDFTDSLDVDKHVDEVVSLFLSARKA
jgi:AcrR family transcriptional regulator